MQSQPAGFVGHLPCWPSHVPSVVLLWPPSKGTGSDPFAERRRTSGGCWRENVRADSKTEERESVTRTDLQEFDMGTGDGSEPPKSMSRRDVYGTGGLWRRDLKTPDVLFSHTHLCRCRGQRRGQSQCSVWPRHKQ